MDDKIVINGVTYVKKDDVKASDYVLVRTYASGVFYGILDKEKTTETVKVLKNARRIWYWSGAASLSQLANEGVKNPDECKFPAAVPYVELTSPQGFEILPVSEEALKSLNSVKEWRCD